MSRGKPLPAMAGRPDPKARLKLLDACNKAGNELGDLFAVDVLDILLKEEHRETLAAAAGLFTPEQLGDAQASEGALMREAGFNAGWQQGAADTLMAVLESAIEAETEGKS